MHSPGDTIQQFRLLRRGDGVLWEIARGASGTTYKAFDTNLDLSVALTIVDAAQVGADVSRPDLVRRARALLLLRDRRIAQVNYVGIDNERVFVVRRYLEGESIAQYVIREGAIDWTESLRIALEIARALQASTESGVVHGNLTPASVILSGPTFERTRREISLIDFALVNVEQLNSRSDIRALGEVLRTMLLGSLPPHEAEMFSRQLQPGTEYLYPNSVPSPVVDLVKQMTSPDDKSGPSSTKELINWISEFLEGPPNPVIPQSTREIFAEGPHETTNPPTDNLQFTAYRPKVIRSSVWTKMLVFAHLEERPSWLNEHERSPHDEVIAQAQQLLGENFDAYRHSTDDSRLAVPRDGEITMLPEIPGIEFNPPRRSFFWKDGIAVHSEAFDMRASNSLDGQTARGRRDWVHLRSGERWHDGLQQLIRAADVFQLFWSPNSANSEFVAQEWQYALGLGRDTFVRPTYWQDPMPDPPEQLRPLHFHRLAVAVPRSAPVSPSPMGSAPMAPIPMSAAPMASMPAPTVRPPEDRPKRSVSVFLILICAVLVAVIVTAIFRG